MPELPEVETVRRTLEPALLGNQILSVEVLCEDYLRDCDRNAIMEQLPQRRFTRLARHGKYLYLILNGLELEAHLGMTGRLIVCPAESEVAKHTHVRLRLPRDQDLRFIDPRRFGYLSIKSPGAALQRHELLGMEPLTPFFTCQRLQALLAARRAPVKSLLLDQKLVAGLGNIYADEALFRARINPEQPACALDDAQYHQLHEAINNVIADAVAARGTSFSDYVDGAGQRGEFLARLSVYGRFQEPCYHCGTLIVRTRISGRSACYCPTCQPLR